MKSSFINKQSIVPTINSFTFNANQLPSSNDAKD